MAKKKLTRRESDILAAILDGCTTDKELMQRLGLSRSTVAKHLVNIYRKMGARSRTDMAVRAMRERRTQNVEQEQTDGTDER
jgi:DNA-binding NarL/FixJ family response regulator